MKKKVLYKGYCFHDQNDNAKKKATTREIEIVITRKLIHALASQSALFCQIRPIRNIDNQPQNVVIKVLLMVSILFERFLTKLTTSTNE
jgi:hypothetical protein